MSDESASLQDTIARLQQAITAQEALRGVLPEEQIDTTVAALRAQMAQLQAQASEGSAFAQQHSTAVGPRGVAADGVGGSIVTGDNNSVQHITHIYRSGGEGPAQVDGPAFQHALGRYLGWVEKRYGDLNLRGIARRDDEVPPLTLDDVYVSLSAIVPPKKSRQRAEPEETLQPIPMQELLPLADRLAIIGGPGCGKTTFLQLIASSVAGALRTGQTAGVRQRLGLKEPLPLPILVTLSDFNRYRKEHGGGANPHVGTLAAFINHGLCTAVPGLPGDFFERLLTQERACLLLLDGLDEVSDERERAQVRDAVVDLAHNDGLRQVVVTSRTRAYAGRSILTPRFQTVTIQPMTPEQVAALVTRWNTAVYTTGSDDAARETQRLLKAIDHLETQRKARGEPRLIDTPLLVTIVAIVHYDGGRLPEKRVELYEKCAGVLLDERYKSATDAQRELVDWGGQPADKRKWLAYLAHRMMGAGEQAGRSIEQPRLEEWLQPRLVQKYGEQAAPAELEKFLTAMRERGSLLTERGGRYEFTHLTFQEYLCATYLADSVSDIDRILAELRQDDRLADAWWRETVLLTAGYLGLRSDERALALLGKLAALTPDGAAALAAAELGGTAFIELESHAAATKTAIVNRLAALLTDPGLSAPPLLRLLAGDALGRLGDPRPGVCTPEPDLIPIPAGSFVMGDQKYRITIAQPFGIARYPVTNAQYRLFVEASGYTEKWRSCWTEEGWEYREENRWTEPRFWDDPARSGENQPVVGISWYEAVAYANWLQAETGKPYRLPTEAEWERAARHTDGRTYPWGDKWREGACNNQDAGLNRAAAVGVFPAGTAACGAADMAGNVWEWCQTRWRDERDKTYPVPYRADDGRENLAGDQSVWRIARGGAYWNDQRAVRCAVRLNDFFGRGFDRYSVRVVASPFPPLASGAFGL